jgi:Tfp pilus assembly PilM family ATPase
VGSVVGLDVGARRVRLVEAETSGRSVRVLRLAEREIEEPADGTGREDAIRATVDALFRESGVSRDEVIFSWPAESCTLREVSVPFQDDDQIRKVAKFELEHHLHGVDIEDVVVDYIRLGPSRDGGTRLLGVAAPKAPLRERLKSVETLRLDPLAVDVDIASLHAAAHVAGVFTEYPSCILLDIGTRSTRIILVAEGSIRSARAMRGGVEGMARALGVDLSLDPAAAEARALSGPRSDDLMAVPAKVAHDGPASEHSAAGLEVAVVEDRKGDYIGRVCREVTRTMAAASGTTFTAVLVTGRGTQVPGVLATLERHLALPVRPLDLFQRIQHPVPPESIDDADATYAVALGAAIRGLRIAPLLLDLRREDLAFSKRFDQIKGAVALALALLLVSVGAFVWKTREEKVHWESEWLAATGLLRSVRDDVERRYEKELDASLSKKLPPMSEEPMDEFTSSAARARAMNNTLQNELGLSTEVPAIISSLEVFRRTQGALAAVREQLEYCLVQQEIYGQRELKLTIVLSDRTHADIVKAALTELSKGDAPVFSSVEYGAITQRKDGKYDPVFTCKLLAGSEP